MSTGRSFASTCTARAALAGNPSDLYGGAVVAVPVPELIAIATVTESDEFSIGASDADLRRLLAATADAFGMTVGRVPAVTLSASTTIPRSVGLAGSSALIIASLRALASSVDHVWEPRELAELALAVERDWLTITAGLQDRLVQAFHTPLAMTFDPVACEPLVAGAPFTMFVAWSPADAQPSDVVHRSLRRRWDAGDEHVRAAMTMLADHARRAATAIAGGDGAALAAAIHGSFQVRCDLVPPSAATLAMAEVAARHRAPVNSAGSGGSVVGLTTGSAHRDRLREVYEDRGYGFVDVDLDGVAGG